MMIRDGMKSSANKH